MLPKKIKILGVVYKILRFRSKKDLGRMRSGKQLIEIASHIPLDVQRSTLVHEIIEAIDTMLELNLPHPTISALETALNGVLADNPQFIKLWKDE